MGRYIRTFGDIILYREGGREGGGEECRIIGKSINLFLQGVFFLFAKEKYWRSGQDVHLVNRRTQVKSQVRYKMLCT